MASPRETIEWDSLARGLGTTLINKYRGHASLTRKSNLSRIASTAPGMRHPETFVITPHFLHSPEDGLSAIQLDKRKAMRAKNATLREEFSANGMGGCWIIKDAQGAKGDNIAVCEGVANALAEVDGGAHQTACVVQRYIRAPLLLPGGRKFDVRCWGPLLPLAPRLHAPPGMVPPNALWRRRVLLLLPLLLPSCSCRRASSCLAATTFDCSQLSS